MSSGHPPYGARESRSFVVVTGCYAQLDSEKVSRMDGVDLVLGSNEKADLIQFLNDARPSPVRAISIRLTM